MCRLTITLFQHTAARRRLAPEYQQILFFDGVSTHSRPKAAGGLQPIDLMRRLRFNTQPPEGGWVIVRVAESKNTVSTHSRPKAAGLVLCQLFSFASVSTHSRPKAAGYLKPSGRAPLQRFQHTAARRRLAPSTKPAL